MTTYLKTTKKEVIDFFNKFDQSKLLTAEEIYGYIASLYPSLDDLYNSTFSNCSNSSGGLFPHLSECILGVHPDFYWAYFYNQHKFFVFKNDEIIAYSTYLLDPFNSQSTNDQKKFLESFKNSIVSEIKQAKTFFNDIFQNKYFLREVTPKLESGYLKHFFENPIKNDRFQSLEAVKLSIFNINDHKPIALPKFRTVISNAYDSFMHSKGVEPFGALGLINAFSKITRLSSPLLLLEALMRMASSYNKSSASRTELDKHNSTIFLDFIRSLPNNVFLFNISELQKTLYLSDNSTPLIKYIGVYKSSLRKPYENYFKILSQGNYFGTDYYSAYWYYNFQKEEYNNSVNFQFNNKTTDELIASISDINQDIISSTDSDLNKMDLCLAQCCKAIDDAKTLKSELNYPDLDNLFGLLFEYLKTYHRYINFCQEFRAEFIDYLEPQEIVVI